MKVPFSWLKDYVDIDVSAQELTEKLFSCGFEVEELIYCGAEIDRCVVGRIAHIEKHPDADKLRVCKLDCGEYGHDIQIVTGAGNVSEGDVVPVALASVKAGCRMTVYANGDQTQYLDLSFVCRLAEGGSAEPRVADDESLEVGWFSPDALPEPLAASTVERMAHIAAWREAGAGAALFSFGG